MTHFVYGERIAREVPIRVGCSATVFGSGRATLLLTRRTDNQQWCLPGGGVDPGETVEEAVLRELWEETGLQGRVVQFLGVYSTPHRVVAYPDGNRFQIIALNFEVEIVDGELVLTDETTAFGYFPPDEIAGLDLLDAHRERVADIFSGQPGPFIR